MLLQLWSKHKDLARGSDLAEAENVLQEAYARAFARWSRVGAYDLPEAWVRRVAINLAAMADRSLRRPCRPAPCPWPSGR